MPKVKQIERRWVSRSQRNCILLGYGFVEYEESRDAGK